MSTATGFRRRRPAVRGQALAAWALCGALLCAPLASALAQTNRPGAPLASAAATDWSGLGPAQRQALKPLERDWATIDAPRRQKWLEIAARFDRMNPDERALVQQRMADWVRLSPKERSEARQNYQGAQQLSPQERAERWEAYQALPEDQRRGLAARAREPAPPARASGPARAPDSAKVNTVPNPLLEARKPRPVAPSVVQARPGATTNSIATKPAPPLHQQTGLPKVAATPEFVDQATLLPQRGAQGAAAAEPRRKKP